MHVPIDMHEGAVSASVAMIHPELLSILVCPETKQPLEVASPEILERVNTAVKEGYLRNQGGEAVKEPLNEALVREDGKVLYPVRDDIIPVLLLDEAIRLDALI
jgi:uncharacterized protein YbaR (Trm112 family)